MERRELIRAVRECASRYDTTMASAARKALHIMDGPTQRVRPRRPKRKPMDCDVKGCMRNTHSPMDWV